MKLKKSILWKIYSTNFTTISVLYYLVLMVLVLSTVNCGGTRKTDTTHTELKSNNLSINNNIELKQNKALFDVFSLQPIDNTKPIIINGTSYYNASIIFDKSKFENLEIKGNDNLSIDRTSETKKDKQTERKNNTFLWIGIAFIIALFIFLWFYLPRLKK